MRIRGIATLFLFFASAISYGQKFTLQDTTVKSGAILISYDIMFDCNSAVIEPESVVFLDSVAIFMLQHKTLIIEVGQHCDERFLDSYSTCLTCQRAKVIVDYLIKKGVSAKRLVAKGYNDEKPLIKGAKREEEHQINRRTEFKILKTDYIE